MGFFLGGGGGGKRSLKENFSFFKKKKESANLRLNTNPPEFDFKREGFKDNALGKVFDLPIFHLIKNFTEH